MEKHQKIRDEINMLTAVNESPGVEPELVETNVKKIEQLKWREAKDAWKYKDPELVDMNDQDFFN